MQVQVALKAIRPNFLILTPVCIFLGVAVSLNSSPIDYSVAALVLLGALTAHIGVNALNEYFDFKSGLDLITEKTSFSGGSGALPAHPAMATPVLWIGAFALAITAAVGAYFVAQRGAQILPLGLVGMALIVTYTPWLNRWPLLCLIAPGLGFGPLMVIGTQIVLTGQSSASAWFVSIVPFCLVNNLLLLNQYPDISADARIGRRTFPIVYGVARSNAAYLFFVLSAYLTIVFLVLRNYLPMLSLIALMPMLLSLFGFVGAVKCGARIGDSAKYLAANVAAALLTPLLLGVAVICS